MLDISTVPVVKQLITRGAPNLYTLNHFQPHRTIIDQVKEVHQILGENAAFPCGQNMSKLSPTSQVWDQPAAAKSEVKKKKKKHGKSQGATNLPNQKNGSCLKT